jgi:hypothetical protein
VRIGNPGSEYLLTPYLDWESEEHVLFTGPISRRWRPRNRCIRPTCGQAWTDAEKARIADLNWRIVAEKH